ncbi:MAG: glycosyltransferase family 2 protein [Planctomycetota bacterium]
MRHLTISIFAYNDAESLEPLVREIVDAATQVTDDFGILIIDDGSKDETLAIARKLAKADSRIEVLPHPVNLGFGPTLRDACIHPNSEWVLLLPGDGQVPPRELLKLYPLTKDHQYILGYRQLRQDPWYRSVNSWVYNRLVRMLAGRMIHDVNSSALINRKVIAHVKFRANSAFIHAELLLESLRHGASFAEVRIDHRQRQFGMASGSKFSVILATMRDLMKYWIRRGPVPFPVEPWHPDHFVAPDESKSQWKP